MPSPIAPPPKHLNSETCDVEKEEEEEELSPHNNGFDPVELRKFYEEFDRSDGFDLDFSKFSLSVTVLRPLDLEDDDWADEPDNNRDMIKKLSVFAINKHNEEKGTKLEVEDVVKANWQPSAAVTFYITFTVRDPSDGGVVKTYQAMVRDLNVDDRDVVFCRPKPRP